MHITTALIFICVVLIIFTFLLRIPDKLIIFIVLAIVLVILFKIFIDLKAFIYEDSGEIISIKSYHPLKKKIYSPGLEFPVKQLKDYVIRENIEGYSVAIIIESLRKKEIRRVYHITGIGKSQFNILVRSLEQIKQLNSNN